ncbi:hypothetical protein [Hydrotalea sp.]|uniref:hypothetical protein n=1 Tax=Hydrotalea sp. TaxID=2881279 RepID=UPI002590A900|nr:hypothetical protein [Hydrotalea sp.]
MFHFHFSTHHKVLIICIAICLFTGFLNYFLLQPNIFLFHVLHLSIHPVFVIHSTFIRNFLLGYFADGLWCLALCLLTLLLKELNYLKKAGIITILVVPFLTEILQYFGIIGGGTFDWLDILTYLLIILAFLLFSTLLKKQ